MEEKTSEGAMKAVAGEGGLESGIGGWKRGGEEPEEQEGEITMELRLSGCRVSPTQAARGRENGWKNLRRNIEGVIRRVDSRAEPSVVGTSYLFSQRNKKSLKVKVKEWTSTNSLLGLVVGAVRRTEQCWSIMGTDHADWVEVITALVDGREGGMRANTRVK